MISFIRSIILFTSFGIGSLLVSSPVVASQTFHFNGLLEDGDKFEAIFTTEENLTTKTFSAHSNPLVPSLTSPAYTFTGYLITGITGNWFEKEAPTTPLSINAIKPVGYIIENSIRNNPPGALDTIAHSPTDNLFDPKNGGLALGKLSFGGIAFVIAGGDDYQLYTDPIKGGYAGCPGSCLTVSEVPLPGSIAIMSTGLMFVYSTIKRRRVEIK